MASFFWSHINVQLTIDRVASISYHSTAASAWASDLAGMHMAQGEREAMKALLDGLYGGVHRNKYAVT
ncbi:MAG: hypothetical protein ACREM3_19040 [Candidatus Rokuibacteriota bacterium]